jgi:hypothetical protein
LITWFHNVDPSPLKPEKSPFFSEIYLGKALPSDGDLL